jgi:hypothetical protein
MPCTPKRAKERNAHSGYPHFYGLFHISPAHVEQRKQLDKQLLALVTPALASSSATTPLPLSNPGGYCLRQRRLILVDNSCSHPIRSKCTIPNTQSSERMHMYVKIYCQPRTQIHPHVRSQFWADWLLDTTMKVSTTGQEHGSDENEHMDGLMTHRHKGNVLLKQVPGGSNKGKDTMSMVTDMEDMEAPRCVLYHPYVATKSRDTCTPNHWHSTYWLSFVTLIERKTRYAVVQHTDTKRYHLMMQLPEDQLSCDECCSSREVFRLPVQDSYAYFVFVPDQDLDGFLSVALAQEAAQRRSIAGDLARLLPEPATKPLQDSSDWNE